MTSVATFIAGLAGLISTVYGISLIYVPAAYIVAGLVVLVAAVNIDRTSEGPSE